MIKVRILPRLLGAAVVLPTLAGCSQEAEDDVAAASDGELVEIKAGTGEITVRGYLAEYRSTSNGDEFIRVGEKLQVNLALSMAIDALAGGDAALASALRADPSKIEATPKITFVRADDTKSELVLAKIAWSGAAGTTASFTVPPGTKRLSIDFEGKTTAGAAPKTVMIFGYHQVRANFPVFGAFLPNKLALFDTLGADRRMRILEGGGVVPGAKISVDVTDWRLDTIVDKSTLDLRIGQQQSGNRFGPAIVDALGALEYEVDAAVSFDDGATWGSAKFEKAPGSDVLGGSAPPGRFVLASLLDVPREARGNMKIAFHVKAFLRVPEQGNILNPRYAPGARILLKDVWDKDGDKDYALRVANR